MDWFRKLIAQITVYWGKWSMLQKVILVAIIVAILAGITALVSVSSSPNLVSLFNGTPIRDDTTRDRIMIRLDQENIKAYETPA